MNTSYLYPIISAISLPFLDTVTGLNFWGGVQKCLSFGRAVCFL